MIVTPDQRLRVFVSSALEELAGERAAVREAVASLRLSPILFELGARPYPPRDLYRAYLEQSHVFLGIYWQSYGWVAPGMEVSGIEDEYLLAQDMPRLIYVKRPAPDRDPRLDGFLDRLRTGADVCYKAFSSPEELRGLVAEDLAVLLTERFQAATVPAGLPEAATAGGSAGRDLPQGEVTFLFTDLEGSTRLLQFLGPRYEEVIAGMYAVIRRELAAAGGIEVSTHGDAFFVVFTDPVQAVSAALAIHRGLGEVAWPEGVEVRVRAGVHTGEGLPRGDYYVGLDVHRAARIAAAAHGGQVLLSAETLRWCESAFSVRDLGFHRLKDLDRPERLYQLLAPGLVESSPPVRSLIGQGNIPADTSQLVGRYAELRAARTQLTRARLLTMTGPGGIGKTRLALRLAREVLDDYAGSVVFVSLASVTDVRAVPSAVAQALGLKEDAAGGSRQVLLDYFAERRSLLILDNFEHLLGAAPVVEELLAAAPQLSVLVTSRSLLHVPGEHQFRVPPLRVANGGGDGASSEAAQLFCDRADALEPGVFSEPGPEVVERICRRLDGLPLAIELAARWVKVLTPSEILGRLDQRLDLLGRQDEGTLARQQTLRAAIDWSYRLLTPSEGEVFRALSVFRGGWSLDGAASVCGVENESDLLDAMRALIDKSLVEASEGVQVGRRFTMLETLREYAAERLEAAGDAELYAARHAQHMLAVAEAASTELMGEAQPQCLALLDIERDNIAIAIHWASRNDRADVGLAIASALWRYWHLRSRLSEGRAFFDELFGLPSATAPTRWRADGLCGLAGLAYWQQDVETTRTSYQEAVTIYTRLDDTRGIAAAKYGLAFVTLIDNDAAKARHLFEQSRVAYEAIGDHRGVVDAMHGLGVTAYRAGDQELAARLVADSIAAYQTLGDRFGASNAVTLLGRVQRLRGRLDEADALLRTAVGDYERVGNLSGLVWALRELAAIAVTRGNPLRAVQLEGAARSLELVLGGGVNRALADWPDPVEIARGCLDDAQVQAALHAGAAMDVDQAAALALLPSDEGRPE